MKTKLSSLLIVAAGLTALGAQAQVAAPSTPAPVIETKSVPPVTQMVYAPRLPSAAELTNAAAAQGLSIDQIVQTDSQLTVTYRSASGQTNSVAYLLLPAAGSPATPATATTVVASAPAPRVVYTEPAPVYYYDPFYYPTYYASPWYTPVSVSLGWGFGHRGGHGGYRGGYHGGYRGGYHGGHHRR